MIVKRQMEYRKHFTTYIQTSWWLFGIIPLYIKNEILGR